MGHFMFAPGVLSRLEALIGTVLLEDPANLTFADCLGLYISCHLPVPIDALPATRK